VATLRWVPGLELGLSRFSHSLWRPGGPTLNDLLRALSSRYGANQVQVANDNQLASAFFRWVFPRRGVEVYGEYGREDYTQYLGSAGALGGAAMVVALDVYHPGGRWTVELTRMLRQDVGDFPRSGQANPQARDIQHAVGVEGLFFRGRYDVTVGLTGVYELN